MCWSCHGRGLDLHDSHHLEQEVSWKVQHGGYQGCSDLECQADCGEHPHDHDRAHQDGDKLKKSNLNVVLDKIKFYNFESNEQVFPVSCNKPSEFGNDDINNKVGRLHIRCAGHL